MKLGFSMLTLFLVHLQAMGQVHASSSLLLIDTLITQHPLAQNRADSILNVDPSFPGGNHLIKDWVQSNLHYPEIARELGEQGIVYVTFVVEEDGTISNVEVLRGGLIDKMNQEAIRMIESMPNWTPGKVNGKCTRIHCRVPVVFVFGMDE